MNIIVVLNYNDAINVEAFIQRMQNYNNIDKFIIVDNCSPDHSFDRLRLLAGDKIDVIQSDKNGGYAKGNNYGVRFAEEKYPGINNIIISNPDIYVSEESLNLILKSLNGKFEMSTGLIHNYDKAKGTKTIASNFGWRTHKYSELLRDCFLITYKIYKSIFHKSNYLSINEIKNNEFLSTEAVPGCFFVIKRQVFDKVGGFDERTFLFGEEEILGYKLKAAGFKVGIVTNAVILHENGTTIKKNTKGKKILEKYLLESELVYIRHFLKKNRIECEIYKILYWLGRKEKWIVQKIMELSNK